MTTPAAQLNQQFYSKVSAGTSDYWHKMAAPRFRRATILRLLGQRPAGNVVDLGCGGGQLLCEIGRRYPHSRLTGVDLSPELIARNRLELPHLEWRAADLCEPEGPPAELCQRFDTIIATELIEHVEDPLQFLKNAARMARPNGRLLLSTQSGPLRCTERHAGHIRHFSAGQMRALLQQAGWRPERVWNAGFPFHDLSKWWANRDPEKSLRHFNERPYGVYENLICWLLRWLFQFNSQRFGAQLFAVAHLP